MVIDKKIAYVKKKELFEPLIPTIPTGLNPIVFIEDTREMWTCGTYFSIGYPSIEVSEESGSIKVTIGNSFFMMSTTGESISVRKGDGNRIILSSNALNRVDTDVPLEWVTADRKLIHKKSGTNAGTFGQSTNVNNASIFSIPNVTVDEWGHVTDIANRNVSIRDYVEQLTPSTSIGERNVLLAYSDMDVSESAQVRKANGMSYNDATKKLILTGGLNSTGAVNVVGSDLTVIDGYIIGKLKGDVEGSATPKIHLSLKPEYGGSSLELYGHVKLQDTLNSKPNPSTSNTNINNTEITAIAASPLMVWNAIETAKAYADSILGANNAMLYKGALEAGLSTPGTYTPAADIGNTYVVTFGSGNYIDNVGYINGEPVEIGDLLICKESAQASNSSNWQDVKKKWTYVQTNTTGVVSGPSASIVGQLAIFNSTTGKLIKGLANGSIGQMMVIGSAGIPKWEDKPDRLNHKLKFRYNLVDFLEFDGHEEKIINFIAGDNMFITVDAQGNITLAADPGSDTVNTAGATNLINRKLFLIGAESQTTSPQTYSNQYVYVGTDNCLYSNGIKVSTEGHTHLYAGSLTAGGAALKIDLNPAGLLGASYGTYAGILQDSTNGPIEGSWSNRLKILHNNDSGYYTELAQTITGVEGLWHRRNTAGSITGWTPIIDKNNFHTYLDDTYIQKQTDPNQLKNFVRYSLESGLTMNWTMGNATPTHVWGAKGGESGQAYVFSGDNIRAFANAVNKAGDVMTGALGVSGYIEIKVGNNSLGYVGQGTSGTSLDLMSYKNGKRLSLNADGSFTYDGSIIWRADNDGTGSGLDADMLDGIQGTGYARANEVDPNYNLNNLNGIGILCNPANATAGIPGNNYPIAEAGTLFYGTAAYGSSNQLYGSYSSNRWFVRGGGSSPTTKTSWVELAKTDWVGANYLPLIGGTLTGDVTFSTDSLLQWSRNTDYAKIHFKNTGDSDTDSYLGFETGDNGNEYFRWAGNAGGTITEWMSLKSDALRFKGSVVWHTGNMIGRRDEHVHSYTLLENLVIAGNEHNWIPANYSGSMWLNYQDITARNSTALIDKYIMGNGRGAKADVEASSFIGSLNGTAEWAKRLEANSQLTYGLNGLTYFNQSMSAGNNAGLNVSPTADWWHILRMNHGNGSGYYVDLGFCFHSDYVAYRRIVGGNAYGWHRIWDSANFNPDSKVNKAGDTMTGVLNINVNGVNVGLGSLNGGFFHIYNNSNASPFIFNKSIYAIGDFYGGDAYNRRLAYIDEILSQVGGTKSAQMNWTSWSTDSAYGGAIQIRETNYVTSSQSAWGYAPRLSFHWGNRYAKSFGMRYDGQFAVDDIPISLSTHNHDSTYVNVTGDTMTGRLTIQSAGLNGTYNGLLVGDDCYIGDCNIGNTIGIMGTTNNSAGMIKLGKNGYQFGYNGSNHFVSGTGLWTNLNADLLDGVHNGNVTANYVNANSQQTLSLTHLDSNTWYPCVMYASPGNSTPVRVTFCNALSSNVPSWSTHGGGFSFQFDFDWIGGGWGTISWYLRIYRHSYSFANDDPCYGLEQRNNRSALVLYMRGGANYQYRTTDGRSFSVYSSNTNIGDSTYPDYVAPRTSRLNNEWEQEASSRVGTCAIASKADRATVADSTERANMLSGHSASPDGSHPGYGAKVFYSWNIGQANNSSAGYSNGITIGSNPGDQAYGFQIVQNMWDDRTYTRRYNSGWQSWKALATTEDVANAIPSGTIIMWLGDNIPSGWEDITSLFDGRFPMGAGTARHPGWGTSVKNTYSAGVNTIGGDDYVTVDGDYLPNHYHRFVNGTNNYLGGTYTESSSDGEFKKISSLNGRHNRGHDSGESTYQGIFRTGSKCNSTGYNYNSSTYAYFTLIPKYRAVRFLRKL